MVVSCVKKDDFDALRHPISVQGEFDPVYGLPVAWYNADLHTLMDLVAYDENLQVTADPESGLLTLSSKYDSHHVYTFDGSKHRPARKAEGDTVVMYRGMLSHDNVIRLGEYMVENDMLINSLYLSLSTYMHAAVSEETQALLSHGVEIYFDTIQMVLDCEVGGSETIDIPMASRTYLRDIMNGREIPLLEHYDISWAINRQAKEVHLQTALNVAATQNTDIGVIMDEAYLHNALKVDSMVVDCHVAIEYSAIMYVGNLREVDTIVADFSNLNTHIDNPDGNMDVSVRLNDTNNYLIIKSENRLPFNIEVQLRGLDSNYHAVTEPLLPAGSCIAAAPIAPVPPEYSHGEYSAYSSSAPAVAELKVPFSAAMMRRLAKASFLELSIRVTSMTEGASESKPFVIIRDSDNLNLKVFVQASPHIGINVPLN